MRLEDTERERWVVPDILQLASISEDGIIITIFLFGPGACPRLLEIRPRRGKRYVGEEFIISVRSLGPNLMSAIEHERSARLGPSGNDKIPIFHPSVNFILLPCIGHEVHGHGVAGRYPEDDTEWEG